MPECLWTWTIQNAHSCNVCDSIIICINSQNSTIETVCSHYMRQEMPEMPVMSVIQNVCSRNAGCVCVIRNPGCVCHTKWYKCWLRHTKWYETQGACVCDTKCVFLFLHLSLWRGPPPPLISLSLSPGCALRAFQYKASPKCTCVCVCFNVRLLNPNISGKLNMTGWQWVKLTPGRKLAPNHQKDKNMSG